MSDLEKAKQIARLFKKHFPDLQIVKLKPEVLLKKEGDPVIINRKRKYRAELMDWFQTKWKKILYKRRRDLNEA